MTEETPGQMLDRLGMDGVKWAAEFRKTAMQLGYSDMDEGWLIGWFANAIMAGYDRAPRADLTPSPEVEKELVEALRKAHEALLWCAREGRMASPSLHQYPEKWAAEIVATFKDLGIMGNVYDLRDILTNYDPENMLPLKGSDKPIKTAPKPELIVPENEAGRIVIYEGGIG